MKFTWKTITEHTFDSLPPGSEIMVCIADRDHIDYVVKDRGKWSYAYSGSEVQNMKKYTHYFIPRSFKTTSNI